MNPPQLPVDEGLTALIASERELGERVLSAMLQLAERHEAPLPGIAWDKAQFSLVKDPFSGEESLMVRWANEDRGTLSLRPGGWVYGELDVCKPHPTKAGQWMEAVVAWGHAEKLKMEMRLLDAPA
ncbi:MAG TPA: hypothetical protein VFW68_11225 [Rhodocyclaceae bacterium]|nr:hypothetical protein [Rhodocyclaceae bacterium]